VVSPLVRQALRAETTGRSIRILEHAVGEARQGGLRLIDAPDDLITGVEWLGVLYLLEGEPARAISPLKDALKCRRRRLGVAHSEVKYLIARLTDAYEQQGRPVRTIPKREQRLAADERQHGTAARRTVRSRYKLFDAYWSAGRVGDAFALFRDALARCEREDGPGATTGIDVRNQLAWAYLDVELPGGVPLLEDNITAMQRAGGRPATLALKRSELAMVYIWYGRAADSIATSRRGLDDIAGLNDAEARLVCKELLSRKAEAVELQAQQRTRPWA
jgi:tetratricopeptide (TPR) repeat protein